MRKNNFRSSRGAAYRRDKTATISVDTRYRGSRARHRYNFKISNRNISTFRNIHSARLHATMSDPDSAE